MVRALGRILLLSIPVWLSSEAIAQTPPAPPTIAPSPSLAKDNHTMALFKKHGMEVVGFWGPTDKEKGSENTLVYVLAFPSRERRDKAFQEFVADPDWQKVRDDSEKNGKLIEKLDSVILMATDYSPLK